MTEVFLNLTEIFLTLTEVFPCFFLRCKANARVKLAKTGHSPHSTTLLFVLFYVLFVCKCVLPPCDNTIAVNKYIIYHRHVIREALFVCFWCDSPQMGQGLLILEVSRSRSTSHHIR
jgi:hypothetical protein